MSDTDNQLVDSLANEITKKKEHDLAIALDFDGVCKLFTEHKHQIMSTCLFLHIREFQSVPFEKYRQAYVTINFRSPEYAGKERFLCVWALSQCLAEKGYKCSLPGMNTAINELKKSSARINEDNLRTFSEFDDVGRLIEWSHEVNERVGQLTGIRLTPGILENIFSPFRDNADFYVVSAATENSLRASLEKDSIDFIKRYFGQETASKAESLLAMNRAGYKYVAMFGDSLEDVRSATYAADSALEGSNVLFIPVIPGEEERCFVAGKSILESCLRDDLRKARSQAGQLTREFEGREVGSKKTAPMSIRE